MPSRHDAEAVQVISGLLSDKVWEAAALNIGAAAQTVSSREWAGKLHDLWQTLPAEVREAPELSRPAAWMAFRMSDWASLERAVSGTTDERLSGFRAVLAAQQARWADVLLWADKTPPDSPEKAVATRFLAAALAELGRPAQVWQGAYETAIELARGRDRGMVLLAYAHDLTMSGYGAQARDVYARARQYLRADAEQLAFGQANLGITCLKVSQFPEARDALMGAFQTLKVLPSSSRAHTVVWRGWGYLALYLGWWPQAQHAFEQALSTAEDLFIAEAIEARRGLIWAARAQGHLDSALQMVHAAMAAQPSPEQRLWLLLEWAALRVSVHDLSGTQEVLAQIDSAYPPPPGVSTRPHAALNPSAQWQKQVIHAELQRRLGQPFTLPEAEPHGLPQLLDAWTFPELFRAAGRSVARPHPVWQVQVDGPIRLFCQELEVPLASTRDSSVLLVMLLHLGSLSVEQALDGLAIEGKDERAKVKKLFVIVRELRQVLGWPGAVVWKDKLLSLSPDLAFGPLTYPVPERAEQFCKGCYVPFVNDTIQEIGQS